MDVHPPKNGINWYWSIPISTWTSKKWEWHPSPSDAPKHSRSLWVIKPVWKAMALGGVLTTNLTGLPDHSDCRPIQDQHVPEYREYVYNIQYMVQVYIYSLYIYTCIIYCILLIIIIYRQSTWPKIPHEHSWVPGYGPCKRLARHFVGEWNPSLKC